MYMWAGSHHLHYYGAAAWVQTLGMTFSVVLLVPSWHPRQRARNPQRRWHKVRDDATLRFMMVAAVFYGLATSKGPFMAIRAVNRCRTIPTGLIGTCPCRRARVGGDDHLRSIYALVPWMWKQDRMYSPKLVEVHFWLSLAGTIIYVFSMWNSGIIQGLMWRTYNESGTLAYSFIDSLVAMRPTTSRGHWRTACSCSARSSDPTMSG